MRLERTPHSNSYFPIASLITAYTDNKSHLFQFGNISLDLAFRKTNLLTNHGCIETAIGIDSVKYSNSFFRQFREFIVQFIVQLIVQLNQYERLP